MPDYGIINDRSPHIVADLCELICYLENTSVSRGDIESFVASKGGDGLLRELNAGNDSETNENVQKLTEDAFQHLRYRLKAFGSWYPFVVDHDVIELRNSQDVKHSIYVALLISSRLKMLPAADRIRRASEFESICYKALSLLLPTWNVYHFGSGGADRHLFGNRLKDALPALAEKTRDDVLMHRVNELSDHNVGDGGIDLAAVFEWADPAQALPVYFAQCAAQQENWPEKKFESHPVTHERFFSFFHKPGSLLFIPVCYRGPDGAWIDSVAMQSILVDRLRLIELFDRGIEKDQISPEDIFGLIQAPIKRGSFSGDGDVEKAAA